MPTVKEILAELRTKPTTNVPNTGKILGDLKPNASYQAAKDKKLGVEVFWIGGKLRCRSIEVLRVLGLENEAEFANTEEQAEATAPPTAADPQPTTRKAPAREASAPRPQREARNPDKPRTKEKAHAIA